MKLITTLSLTLTSAAHAGPNHFIDSSGGGAAGIVLTIIIFIVLAIASAK